MRGFHEDSRDVLVSRAVEGSVAGYRVGFRRSALETWFFQGPLYGRRFGLECGSKHIRVAHSPLGEPCRVARLVSGGLEVTAPRDSARNSSSLARNASSARASLLAQVLSISASCRRARTSRRQRPHKAPLTNPAIPTISSVPVRFSFGHGESAGGGGQSGTLWPRANPEEQHHGGKHHDGNIWSGRSR